MLFPVQQVRFILLRLVNVPLLHILIYWMIGDNYDCTQEAYYKTQGKNETSLLVQLLLLLLLKIICYYYDYFYYHIRARVA